MGLLDKLVSVRRPLPTAHLIIDRTYDCKDFGLGWCSKVAPRRVGESREDGLNRR